MACHKCQSVHNCIILWTWYGRGIKIRPMLLLGGGSSRPQICENVGYESRPLNFLSITYTEPVENTCFWVFRRDHYELHLKEMLWLHKRFFCACGGKILSREDSYESKFLRIDTVCTAPPNSTSIWVLLEENGDLENVRLCSQITL